MLWQIFLLYLCKLLIFSDKKFSLDRIFLRHITKSDAFTPSTEAVLLSCARAYVYG